MEMWKTKVKLCSLPIILLHLLLGLAYLYNMYTLDSHEYVTMVTESVTQNTSLTHRHLHISAETNASTEQNKSNKRHYFPKTVRLSNASDNLSKQNVSQKLTVIIMGYSPGRAANYQTIFAEYGQMQSVIANIIFIWNNLEAPHPPIPTQLKVPLFFIQSLRNSMNNRVNVSHLVNTGAVLLVDDDVLLNEALVTAMLNQWILDPDKLVGLDQRAASRDGIYKAPVDNETATIVIGKTMMFHQRYLAEYMLDEELVQFNDGRYCEDIALSALIRNKTCNNPVTVYMSKVVLLFTFFTSRYLKKK